MGPPLPTLSCKLPLLSLMLPRSHRLARKRDFDAVYVLKRSWADRFLVLYLRRTDPAETEDEAETHRFGFSVSKKVGKAHDRNRIKRRLREICRRDMGGNLLRGGWDVVFVARGPAQSATYAELRGSVQMLMARAGVIARSTSTLEWTPGSVTKREKRVNPS